MKICLTWFIFLASLCPTYAKFSESSQSSQISSEAQSKEPVQSKRYDIDPYGLDFEEEDSEVDPIDETSEYTTDDKEKKNNISPRNLRNEPDSLDYPADTYPDEVKDFESLHDLSEFSTNLDNEIDLGNSESHQKDIYEYKTQGESSSEVQEAPIMAEYYHGPKSSQGSSSSGESKIEEEFLERQSADNTGISSNKNNFQALDEGLLSKNAAVYNAGNMNKQKTSNRLHNPINEEAISSQDGYRNYDQLHGGNKIHTQMIGKGVSHTPNYPMQAIGPEVKIKNSPYQIEQKYPTHLPGSNNINRPSTYNNPQTMKSAKNQHGSPSIMAEISPSGIIHEFKAMHSRQINTEPDIEFVIDCSSCGSECPATCPQPKNNSDTIAAYCCGNSMVTQSNTCPPCPSIDTSNCPVSANEFDGFNEMYYILEVGLKEPYSADLGDSSTVAFQNIRKMCQKFVLSVYHDHPYYQETLVKSVKSSKEYSIVSMLIRFTKSNLKNISPLYKAFMCKCGCEIFYIDLYFKMVPANTSDLYEFCPNYCFQASSNECNANSQCHGCCSEAAPSTMMLRKVSDFGPNMIGPMPFMKPDYSFPIMPQMMCPFGCSANCAPFCSNECCFGSGDFKRTMKKAPLVPKGDHRKPKKP